MSETETDKKDTVDEIKKEEVAVKEAEEPEKSEVVDKTEKVVTEDKTPEVINGITFPSPVGYTGSKGCDGYLNDKQFLAFANSLAQFPTDRNNFV